MAESMESAKPRQETWVLAIVASAGLVCVSLVAVALVLILKQGGPLPAASQPTQTANPVINVQLAPPPAPTPGITRPSEPAKPQANRGAAEDLFAHAVPGKLETTGGRLERVDQQVNNDAAKATLPAPDKKVFLRVRGEVPAPQSGKAPLPMPLRYRADATGNVNQVFASRLSANTPLPPDKLYGESGAAGAQWDVQLSEAKATYAVDGFRAPEGFVFFTATLQLRAKGSAVAPDLGAIEVRDSEGTAYLPNPELSGALPTNYAAGQESKSGLAILVSEQAPLVSLVLNTGDAPISLPLTQR